MSTNRITVGAFHEDPGEQITMSWRDKENLKNWRKRESILCYMPNWMVKIIRVITVKKWLRYIICEVTWFSKYSEGARTLFVDAAFEKARWGWRVVGIGLTEGLGLEYEGWAETEKKEPSENWGGKNFIQKRSGYTLQVLTCLTEQDVGGEGRWEQIMRDARKQIGWMDVTQVKPYWTYFSKTFPWTSV